MSATSVLPLRAIADMGWAKPRRLVLDSASANSSKRLYRSALNAFYGGTSLNHTTPSAKQSSSSTGPHSSAEDVPPRLSDPAWQPFGYWLWKPSITDSSTQHHGSSVTVSCYG
jgi:hypothetical protein